MMRVLLLHNHYQQTGGEDQVFSAEANLLEAHGHQVLRYTLHNDQIAGMTTLKLVKETVWNQNVYRELRAFIRRERPQVVHCHNTFPLISPSAYYAAKAEHVPVVQTLHNFRLVCPSGNLLRSGTVCEDCLTKSLPWPSVVHACYRKSRLITGTVAAMLTVHRSLRTWSQMVDVYITLNEFARTKFIQGGLPAERIVIKPNFVYPDPGYTQESRGGYALYVGRLSDEKGVDTLLAAWEKLKQRIPLKIAGDGPLAELVRDAARRLPGVEWLGQKTLDEIYKLMRRAAFLIIPSKCYEGMPRTIIESYAVGTPVIAADLGSMNVIVKHNQTGLLFRSGDTEMLAGQVDWAMAHPAEVSRMRREARTEYESKYTGEHNYLMLRGIYERVVNNKSSSLE